MFLLRIVLLHGALLTCILASEHTKRHIIVHSVSPYKEKIIKGFTEWGREKRALNTLVQLVSKALSKHTVKKGMTAALRLIHGSRERPSTDKMTRVYEKNGDYLTALRDFKSVSPEDISTFSLPSGNKGIFGKVGDRTLMVEKKGDTGKPTILIIRNMGSAKEGKDKIIYVKKSRFFSWRSK